MKKFVCPVCGYVYEGEFIPEGFKCPVCGVDGSKFKVMEEGKLAACAKKNGLDAIHDTVHEMAKDEARHGKALQGMLNRYFAKEIALEKAAAKANKAAAVVSDAVTTAAEKLSEIIKK